MNLRSITISIVIIVTALLSWYFFTDKNPLVLVGFSKEENIKSEEKGLAIRLYYYNPGLDQGPGGVQCTENGLVFVERIISQTNTPLAEAIKLLLRGEISDSEKAKGITSEFPLSGVTLKSAVIQNGVAVLTFNDPENKTGGGSCRVATLRAQIEATAKQFPAVRSLQFMPEELFQP